MLSQGVKWLAERPEGRTLAEIVHSGQVSVAAVQRRLNFPKGHEAEHLEDSP
ncbi:hypothetical protein [Planctomyces sp. SH-PL62]|uniref:hypothetical protein n=1 Tax=Planctomyces sp. SH-PL62 TaxID=1636152 RepID=UPI0012E79F99|nr:hypothetical protein [Planctomyces sp. SH-PL62]